MRSERLAAPAGGELLTVFLRSLIERGLDISRGLLLIIDGGKGCGRRLARHWATGR